MKLFVFCNTSLCFNLLTDIKIRALQKTNIELLLIIIKFRF